MRLLFFIALAILWAPLVAQAATIQGYKVKWQDPGFDYTTVFDMTSIPSAQETISSDDGPSQSTNPYFLLGVTPGQRTITTTVPAAGWKVAGFTLCKQGLAPLNGNAPCVNYRPMTETENPSITFAVAAGDTWDLWWYYKPPPGILQGDTHGGTSTIIAGKHILTTKPYSVTLAAGTYSVVTTVPDGFTASYSLCDNCIQHPPESYLPGNLVKVDVKPNQYVDLHWNFSPSGPLAPFFKIVEPYKTGKFTGSYAPAIIKEGETTHVFTCGAPTPNRQHGVGYTASNDNGQTWSTPVIAVQANGAGAVDLDACDPSVVYFGGYYYLYYSSVYNPGGGNLTNVQVARSANIAGPYLIYTDRGTWEAAPADPKKLVLPKQPRADNSGYYGAGQQSVVVRNGKLLMWYNDDTPGQATYFQTYYMESSDPVSWNYLNSTPITVPGLPAGFFGGNHSPDIKFDPLTQKFIMLGFPKQQTPNSSMAVSTSDDGLTWTAYRTIRDEASFPNFAHNPGFSSDRTGAMPAGQSLVGFAASYDFNETTSQTVNFWNVYGLFAELRDLLPAPTISQTYPTTAIAGESGFWLTVRGSNFDAGTKALWNSAVLETEVTGPTHLRAYVPATSIANAGTATITVRNSQGTPSTSQGSFVTEPALVIPTCGGQTIERYVSPTGNDANAGTAGSPFRTLQRARDAVRTLNGNMNDCVRVVLEDGFHHLQAPLTLDARDSGSNGRFVVYTNAPGAKPVISGGREISGWNEVQTSQGPLWRASVGQGFQTRQLYVNGVRAMRARTTGSVNLSLSANGFTTSDSKLNGMQSWQNPTHVEVGFDICWRTVRCGAQSISAGNLFIDEPVCFSAAKSMLGDPACTGSPATYWVENALELLDTPGEWYLDSVAGYLYYKPLSGQLITNTAVVAPVLESLINIEGTQAAPAHHIVFRGLNFAFATWLRPDNTDGFVERQANFTQTSLSQWTRTPGAVNVTWGRSIYFERNNFAYLGAAGLDLAHSQGSVLQGNHFYDISGSAIQLGEEVNPTSTSATSRNNHVLSNYIHDIAQEYHGGVGIWMGLGQNNLVSHNELEKLPYTGISVGWDWSTSPTVAMNNRVQTNFIHHHMQTLDDGGGIYTLGAQPGNLYMENRIEAQLNDYGALYLDAGSQYLTFSENVIFGNKRTAFIKGGDNDLHNNWWQDRFANDVWLHQPEIFGPITLQNNTLINSLAEARADLVANAGLEAAFQGIKTNLVPFPAPIPPPPPPPPPLTSQNGNFLYLDNGTVRIGLDLAWGGSIVELSVGGNNFVNAHDPGREIQPAIYDGNATYDSCSGCTGVFGWNPVLAGDEHGHGSPVLDYAITNGILYTKTRPLEWNPDDKGGSATQAVLSDVEIEQWISAVPNHPNAVKVRHKVTHLGSDLHANALQELPMLALTTEQSHLVTYGGASPWTSGAVTLVQSLPAVGSPAVPYRSSEFWSALVNNQNAGVMVYDPASYGFAYGFSYAGPGGPTGDGTIYMRQVSAATLPPNGVLDTEVYLLGGDYTQARQAVYDLHQNLSSRDPYSPIGWLDVPAAGATVSGTTNVGGWAYDNRALDRIEVWLDGALAGTAIYGGARPDVAINGYPGAPVDIGFNFGLNSALYANGQHLIQIRAYDAAGNIAVLPERAITFSNELAAPSAVQTMAVSTRAIHLSWTPSTAPSLLSHRIYRNGTLVGSARKGVNFFTDTSLAPNTLYSYTIAAWDGTTESVKTPVVQERTSAVTTPVSGPAAVIPYSHLRSVVWYPYPDLVSTSANRLAPLLPSIKASGFNALWLGGNSWLEYNPKPLDTPFVANQASFDGLRQTLQLLRDNGMVAMVGLNYLGQGWSPEGIDPCTWTHDLRSYKAFETYVREFLTRIEDYSDVVYPIVFTEGAEGCTNDGIVWGANPSPPELAPLLRSTLGSLPDRLPAALRAKFRFGYHDYSVLSFNFGQGQSPIASATTFDFGSGVYYYNARSLTQRIPPAQQATETQDMITRWKTRYPNLPLIIGELGANRCSPSDETDQSQSLSAILNRAVQNRVGINVWGWMSFADNLACTAPNFDDFGLVHNDGTTPRPALAAVIEALRPKISAGDVVTTFNPWAAWVRAVNLGASMDVNLWDQGQFWGKGTGIALDWKNDLITFSLPSNNPPSQCNANGPCTIEISIAEIGSGLTSPRFSLTLPQASAPPPPPPPPPPPEPFDLPTPVLRLPAILPITALVSVDYPSSYSISRFEWTLTPELAPLNAGGISARAPSLTTFNTPNTQASLASYALSPGAYLFEVAAVDRDGKRSARASARTTLVAGEISGLRVYPNPWKANRDSARPVTFGDLPANCRIRIFTIDGRLVEDISNASGSATWDLRSRDGNTVASGIYLYVIEDDQGRRSRGQLVIIR